MKLDELPWAPRQTILNSLWDSCCVALRQPYYIYIETPTRHHDGNEYPRDHYWVQLRIGVPYEPVPANLKVRAWAKLPALEAQCLLHDIQNNLESYLKG